MCPSINPENRCDDFKSRMVVFVNGTLYSQHLLAFEITEPDSSEGQTAIAPTFPAAVNGTCTTTIAAGTLERFTPVQAELTPRALCYERQDETMRGLLLPAALLVLLIPCRATHPSRQGAQPAGWRETHLFSEDRLWRRQLPTPGLSVGQSAAWIRRASALPVRNVNRTGCAGITHSLEGHEVILKTAVLFKQCTATLHSARADEERAFPIQRPGLSWRILKTQ
jgi:hypothetical protein